MIPFLLLLILPLVRGAIDSAQSDKFQSNWDFSSHKTNLIPHTGGKNEYFGAVMDLGSGDVYGDRAANGAKNQFAGFPNTDDEDLYNSVLESGASGGWQPRTFTTGSMDWDWNFMESSGDGSPWLIETTTDLPSPSEIITQEAIPTGTPGTGEPRRTTPLSTRPTPSPVPVTPKVVGGSSSKDYSSLQSTTTTASRTRSSTAFTPSTSKSTPKPVVTTKSSSVITPSPPPSSTASDTLVAPWLRPGILAAVIAGAVVGLLAAIMLVMFIVYRMRKRDEGSYAIDETKASFPSYAYHKAQPQEFYA